ncbi:MAG: glycosyltransferase family 4 protein [Gaiellaceae bacterium]
MLVTTLNVLHISDSDAGGGSARSAFRLHSTLRRLGHGSRMLVGRPQTGDLDVRSIKRGPLWRAADRVCGAVADPLGLQYVLYPSSFGVARDPWFRGAGVVQLYNTHGSYFSHTALPLLSRRRPVVWRLSDMWPFTGHVAYSYDCERWRHGCGSCPYLQEYPGLPRDTTAMLFRVKRAVYRRSRLTVVAPSRWLERLAGESPLLGRFPRRRIPNGVDLDAFRPLDRRDARRRLGLDPERPLVLFSAPDLADRRKGAAIFREAVARLADAELQVVSLAGAADPELALHYAAAEVFVLPTLADNLPNAAIESLACATPVVSFDVGGVPDAVRHLETGYLAPAGDAAGLAEGIRALLSDGELRSRLSARAREVAESEFAAELEARRFAELYEELVAA